MVARYSRHPPSLTCLVGGAAGAAVASRVALLAGVAVELQARGSCRRAAGGIDLAAQRERQRK
jgi:hypothetical protein